MFIFETELFVYELCIDFINIYVMIVLVKQEGYSIYMKRLKIFTIIDGIVAFLLLFVAFISDYTAYVTNNISLDSPSIKATLIFALVFFILFGIFAVSLFILLVSFFIKRSVNPLILFLVIDFAAVFIYSFVQHFVYELTLNGSHLFKLAYSILDNIMFAGLILFAYALLILIVASLIKLYQ